ncbi:hypothetical protein EII17_08055 [Clostridiales bacterium COT073_COT-073]|nr:hypothetical protein EII17_08055 [Clostridiales bacterium COT073_COT-073]
MKKGIALVIGIMGIALYFLCINKDIIKHNAQEVTMERIAEEIKSQKPVKVQNLPEPARTMIC